jgi:16S rRNA (adenine1518-N6/adenine1519-N6)-dimethyltransferase
VPRREPKFPIADQRRFALVVAQLFSMRRKTLGRILKSELSADTLRAGGFDPGARPETLSPADFARLAALTG